MKIWIYPQDGVVYPTAANYYELTPYISDVDEQKRSDDAFAITTFKVIIPSTLFPLAKYNIAPFTIFEIGTSIQGSDSVRYFGYSKCTKYVRQQSGVTYFVHEITLLEPLVLLEAIQIGAKTFTNAYDNTYLRRLSTIIENTTGYEILFAGHWNVTEPHSFSWDKGTSAFEIANDIFRIHNYKMKAELTIDSYPYWIRMIIEPIYLDDIQELTIDEDAIIYSEYSQSQDDYCRNLESQVDNVVDRNTNTLFNDLTVRSDETLCNANNCFIELPSKIESVDSLKFYTNVTQTINIDISDEDYQNLIGNYSSPFTYSEISECVPFVDELAQQAVAANPNIDVSLFEFTVGGTGGTYWRLVGTSTNDLWYDITQLCLDSTIYMALEPAEKTKYCYYTSGSNKIEGIYEYYQDDWVHTILGTTGNPLLNNIGETMNIDLYTDVQIGEESGYTIYEGFIYEVTNNNNDNPINYRFSVKAKPITNQYVKDVKTDPPINSASIAGYVNVARSYGNSANYIDYDIMRKNISISNKSLGTPELTLQFLNECNLTANSKFTYDNKTWYVKSIIMNIFRNKIIYTVNSANDYNKQADAIGVRTQYEATKIDLVNTKDRHLYYRNTTTTTLDSEHTYYFLCSFTYADGSTKQVIVPCSLYYNSNSGVTLVFNFPDNFSCGKYLSVSDQTGDVYIVNDCSYVDNNGEAESITISLVYVRADTISNEQSRYMPNLPHSLTYYTLLTVISNQTIYKDEHEALSITLYMPNATYSE